MSDSINIDKATVSTGDPFSNGMATTGTNPFASPLPDPWGVCSHCGIRVLSGEVWKHVNWHQSQDAKQLEIADLRTVSILDEQGVSIGEVFPERGVVLLIKLARRIVRNVQELKSFGRDSFM